MTPAALWDMQSSMRQLYTMCVEPVCQSCGVTRTELDILLFLANNPEYDTAAEISDIRCLAKSHVSTSLKSLEAGGYITKAAEPEDRRKVHLKLTAAAEDVIRAGRNRQSVFADIISEGFSPDEKEQIRSTLERIGRNIKKYLEVHAE